MIKLYDFQQKLLDNVQHKNRVAFFADMGLGKTLMGSEKVNQLDKPFSLVVCQKSKVKDWIDHFKQHYSELIFNLTDKKEFELFMAYATYKKPRYWNFNCIGVINYDLLIRRPELLQLQKFTLMLDESQAIQNEQAKRTKFILKMNPSDVILLSGTPVSGRYEQLYAQIKLLGWNISKTDFWKRYIVWRDWKPVDGMYPIKIVTGYKNVDELKEKLREHGAQFLKSEDVLTLPEQVFNNVYVDTSPQYRKFVRDRIVKFDGDFIVGDTTFNNLLGLRKLCGMYSKEKLTAFKDLIESTSDRIVVFYNFWGELEVMKSVIGDRHCCEVNSENNDLSVFEEHDDCILFVNYSAGSSGLNLQKANKIIYFTPPLSSSNFEQSKKRVHRIGQSKTCFYYYLICRDSVEEKIYDALSKRKDFTDKLFEETK